MATAVSGATQTVVLLWAAVVALTISMAVTIIRAVTAWRRAYRLGRHLARTTAALGRQPVRARAEK
ncbi:hypothetical protein ABZ912_05370 [Nonomuraea angiospora]|uniref:hypothetical protein n=1 Tax=Nonomuraea angiospora TaxID=46172 RepID=UPI0033CA9114